MSPVPPIAHLIAIAAGVLGGLWLGGAISPDLPSAETEPGVVVSGEVPGSDPRSLFRTGPLQEAVTQTIDQLGAGAEVSSVSIQPSILNATDAGGEGATSLESMPVDAPERMVAGIEAAREDAGAKGRVTLDDFEELTWTPAKPTASEWYVLLDVTTVGPPTEFAASRDGARVRAGAP